MMRSCDAGFDRDGKPRRVHHGTETTVPDCGHATAGLTPAAGPSSCQLAPAATEPLNSTVTQFDPMAITLMHPSSGPSLVSARKALGTVLPSHVTLPAKKIFTCSAGVLVCT